MGGPGKDWVADYDHEHLRFDLTKPITMSFTIQDINKDTLRALFGADLFDTQEDYIMTNPATKPTNKTPDGTILRLVDAGFMSANEGAIAVVDNSKRTRASHPENVSVRWIKGGNDSRDGTYMPYRFELTGFAIGDRVEVTGMPDGFEKGWRGVILGDAVTNGDDVRVKTDNGRTPTYLLEHFKKIEEPKVSDFQKGDAVEAVATSSGLSWEIGDRGTVEGPSATGSFVRVTFDGHRRAQLALPAELKKVEKVAKPKFKLDDIAVLQIPGGHRWDGVRVRVIGFDHNLIKALPLDKGNDILRYGDPARFAERELRAFDPAGDYKEGDKVQVIRGAGDFHYLRHGSVATIAGSAWGERISVTGVTSLKGQVAFQTVRHGDIKLIDQGTPATKAEPKPALAPKPKPKFEVGDRVYWSGPKYGPLDEPGTVVEVRDGGARFRVDFDKQPFPQLHEAHMLTALKSQHDPKAKAKVEAEFKVGDRAKVIDPSGARYIAKFGEIVTVLAVEDFSYSGKTYLTVRNSDGEKYGMYARRFERVAEPVREEFTFAGAYVADKAGLDALPVGSVIEEVGNIFGVDVRIKLRKVGETAQWYRMGLGGPSQFPLPTPGSGEFLRRTWVVKHVPGEFAETKAA